MTVISVKVERAVVSKVLRLWSMFRFSAKIPVANCNTPGVIIFGVDEIVCNGRCETAPAAALSCEVRFRGIFENSRVQSAEASATNDTEARKTDWSVLKSV